MPVQTTTLMRRYLRFSRYLLVKCAALRPGYPERTLLGRTQDVSVGGLAVLLPETLPFGIALWVQVDEGDPLLGRVVWVGRGMQTLRGTAFLHGLVFAQPVDPALVRKWVSDAKQREHDRVPVGFDVEYIQDGTPAQGMCLNLSEGGMFVQTGQPPSPGTEVLLHFTPPANSHPLAIRSRVAWTSREEAEPGAISGMGVQFLEPKRSDVALIGAVVDRVRAEAFSMQDSSRFLPGSGE